MKICEYIDSHYLTIENIIQHTSFQSHIDYLMEHSPQRDNFVRVVINEDVLENENMETLFQSYQNKILFLDCIDIDFPPPQKPWRYDKYFPLFPFMCKEVPYSYKIQTSLLPILEKNNLHLIGYSISQTHPHLTSVPAGIFHQFQSDFFHFKTNEKTILCYANFGIPCDRWFGNPRKECLEMIQSKNFIMIENGKTQEQFYQTIAKSKFTLCPRGCGIDTYRLWDVICLGSIPIVENTGALEDWKDLPIWFIDSWKDFETMTEEKMLSKYTEMIDCDYKYEKMTLSFWQTIIETKLNKMLEYKREKVEKGKMEKEDKPIFIST